MMPITTTKQSEADKDRAAFIHALDHSPLEITDWESHFLETNINRRTFSDGQRQVIDTLVSRYGPRLKW